MKNENTSLGLRTFDGKFWLIFIPFLIIIFLILFFPYWFSQFQVFNFDFKTTGQIGDTIGGIMGPFIAIAAAILTFFAFWVQFKANDQQKIDLKIERFENKFYELVRLHKENVSEIKIKRSEDYVDNRRAFVLMYYEFRYTFHCCKYIHDELFQIQNLARQYSDEELVRLAYIFFYAGIGDNSDMLSSAMNIAEPNRFENILFDSVKSYLYDIKSKNITQPNFIDNDGNTVSLKIKYLPWGGHQSRLGHYYRHLFQTVKFIVNQDKKFITKQSKLEYLRTLRAQLSDHEQLMLYYNAISHFGYAWIVNKYFTDYKMIHNIPMPLANFGISPEVKFANELLFDSDLFEWS